MMRKKSLIALVLTTVVSISLGSGLGTNISVNAADINYNYGEALQKSIMFYEFQRSGKLPENTRCNWRADSALDDGSDVGLDLTGGWYDAGDHVKFNLPGAYSSTMLAWSVYEDKESYINSGQLDYMLDAIKWENDFLIKCHPEPNVYYYQVGDGGKDHQWWGAPEVMQMARPSEKVDLEHPGTAVVSEAAASLASCSIIFKDKDPEYAEICLKHAKELFEFADATRSDTGYTKANGYYTSSGFWDELTWAATWLYMATGESDYLDKAEELVSKWPKEQQSDYISFSWGQCWDDVHFGTQLLLAKLTGKDLYKESVEHNLDFWTIGFNGRKVTYTPKGLAWLSNWGSLRYATTTAFLAGIYADWDKADPEKAERYEEFMESQIKYALGSTGRSYVTGYGENYPEHIHHRAAQGSWTDKNTEPGYNRHLLYGALVGGPDANDGYKDEINEYQYSEVACDYNAGFVGALAKMYKKYGGETIENLNAIEPVANDEYYVEAGVNAIGNDFTEIKALVHNETGWPARVGDKISIRYFFDISELVEHGLSAKDLTVTCNYNQGAKVSAVKAWDEEKNIYYVDADFTGTKIYPGGQSATKKEVQFRIAAPNESRIWDPTNDFSYEGITLTPGEVPVKTDKIAVYDDGVLVWGKTPDGQSASETPVTPVDPDKPSDTDEITESDILGDVNRDGKVNIKDYIKLQKHILNSNIEIDINGADMNGDGKINITDALLLKKVLIG